MNKNRFPRLPFVPPVNLKAINDRTIPKTSTVKRVCTLPVLGSGRNNSRDFPLDTSISCILLPLKLPWTAWVIPVARCKVKLYRCILNSSTNQVSLNFWKALPETQRQQYCMFYPLLIYKDNIQTLIKDALIELHNNNNTLKPLIPVMQLYPMYHSAQWCFIFTLTKH